MGSKINHDEGYAVKFADLVTQSYHPVKNFTTGEGGSILTNELILNERIKSLRNHGMIKKDIYKIKIDFFIKWYL